MFVVYGFQEHEELVLIFTYIFFFLNKNEITHWFDSDASVNSCPSCCVLNAG